jgi:hypothetical protein
MPTGTGITVSADRIPDYPAIDIRGQGGYVASAGSIVDGGTYTVEADAPLAISPPELVDLARSAQGRARETKDREAVAEVDTIEAVLRSAEWLRNGAPEAIEGAGGDHMTYIVACRLRDYGLSATTAFELMSTHWNDAGKASPPWAPDELQQKIENAFAYAKNPQGARLASAEFEVVPEDEAPDTPGRWEIGVKGRSAKIFALDFEASAAMAVSDDTEPLIDGILDVGAMSVMYGASNSGKTFVALDQGFHIAAGIPWQGRRVAQGLVVHLVLEGGRGFHKRVAALQKRYGTEIGDRKIPFVIIPCPIDMRTSGADVRAVARLVEDIAKAYDVPVRLVTIDTLSRALAGGEENGSQDMGAFVTNADALRHAVLAHVMTIHHSGKDAAKGARGHSLLRAATDTEIEIADNEIRSTKQRDMESASAIRFELERVDLGASPNGKAISSCVVKLLTGSEFQVVELSRAADEMWEAFQDAGKDMAVANGAPGAAWRTQIVSTEVWDEAYRKARAVGESKKEVVSARWMSKLRKEVVDSGRIRKVKENQWVAPAEQETLFLGSSACSAGPPE